MSNPDYCSHSSCIGLEKKLCVLGMFGTLVKSSDVFPHWEKDDEKVGKIVQTEDCGASSTFLSDKVDFKGDINNLFSI